MELEENLYEIFEKITDKEFKNLSLEEKKKLYLYARSSIVLGLGSIVTNSMMGILSLIGIYKNYADDIAAHHINLNSVDGSVIFFLAALIMTAALIDVEIEDTNNIKNKLKSLTITNEIKN